MSSILELVPEGWHFAGLAVNNFGVHTASLERDGYTEHISGQGPTPESAINDAAEKARGE